MKILVHHSKHENIYYSGNTQDEINRAYAHIMLTHKNDIVPMMKPNEPQPVTVTMTENDDPIAIMAEVTQKNARIRAKFEKRQEAYNKFVTAMNQSLDDLSHDPDLKKYWYNYFEGEYFIVSLAEVHHP